MNRAGHFSLTLPFAIAAACAVATPCVAQDDPSSPPPHSAPAPAATEGEQRQAPETRRPRRPRRRQRDVIAREEIAESGAADLYELVHRARPDWLSGGNISNVGGGGTGVVVYQNSSPLGGLDALRQLSPDFAAELRFLDGVTASNTLPGLGSRRVAGAIVIVTPGYSR